ncbi:hypothetical protein O9992_19970 [Vibrio lentus]|nr:hypothetical protein [Vibrio lentus]
MDRKVMVGSSREMVSLKASSTIKDWIELLKASAHSSHSLLDGYFARTRMRRKTQSCVIAPSVSNRITHAADFSTRTLGEKLLRAKSNRILS